MTTAPERGQPNILIVNFHSSDNAGDLALLLCVREQLTDAFGNPRIVVSSNWPEEQAYQNYGLEVIPSIGALCAVNRDVSQLKQIFLLVGRLIQILCSGRSSSKRRSSTRAGGWRALHDAYAQANLVVAASGNQFFSTGRFGWPFLVGFMSITLAHWFRKPLYVMPQSIGPFKRGWERALLRWGYKKARKVFLRDAYSMRLAATLGLKEGQFAYAPDPAFTLEPVAEVEAQELLMAYGVNFAKARLGVTVIAPIASAVASDALANYYEVIKTVLKRFIVAHGAQVILFNQVVGPTAAENDGLAAAEICTQLQQEGLDIVHIDRQVSPALLKAAYGLMDAFLASRLHSGIFALGMHVPTLFVGYLSKTRGLLESLGLQEWVVDLGELSEDALWEKLERLWSGRESQAEVLAAMLPGILQTANETAAWIRQDYAHGRK